MSTVKLEHVNPLTGKPVAFDILVRDSDEVRETFVLNHGQFRIFDLAGGLVLREVSAEEIAERERKLREQAELEAEVARERQAKEDAAQAERVAAEKAERKAEVERLAGGEMATVGTENTEFDPNAKPEPAGFNERMHADNDWMGA